MAHDSSSPDLPKLPSQPVHLVTGAFTRFLHVEAASGGILLLAAVSALILANSPLSESFLNFWETPIGFTLGSFEMQHSLKHWIDDGLMAIFFFVVGLEIKRELVLGELSDLRQAALPIAAAMGGMVVPAAVYVALQSGGEAPHAWGIPMATDIAFVVGCIAVLGDRVPRGLRVMLLSLAIVDDIGAVLVIAVFYTDTILWNWLFFGFGGIALTVFMARIGVRSVLIYAVVGILIWFGFHESGVHATIAGVILGLMTPAHPHVPSDLMKKIVKRVGEQFSGDEDENTSQREDALRHMKVASQEAIAPLARIENALHPWVAFLIMPLFALDNAGVAIRLSDFAEPLGLSIMAGLVIGKPLGVGLASWIAIRSGIASLPKGVTWGMIIAGGFLSGIGFTMALFIAGLALEPALLDKAKVGILGASALAAVIGMTMLLKILPPKSDS